MAKSDAASLAANKAKGEAMTFKLALGSLGEKTFELTDQWQRYEIVCPPKEYKRTHHGGASASITLIGEGTAWFDLAQITPEIAIQSTRTADRHGFTVKMECYMGYKPHNQRIEINKDLSLNIKLVPMTFALKEVTVKTRQSIDELNESTPSNMISFNSTDFFSKINILPGVINSDASGHFNVNGGNDDENLILLDGIQIYHPNHLNPMLSPLNGDAIKNITFHKNYFPTEYEGRLSSVTDIKIKEGNKQKFMIAQHFT